MEFSKEDIALHLRKMHKLGFSQKEAMRTLALGRELLNVKPDSLKKDRYVTLNEILQEAKEFDIEDTRRLLNTYFNN